ncbi:MAG: zinc ABC transporter substrate-binding protein [Chloroflexi bacterium]|nr:zinc ABC transporter substrate-binding protein [Chloroflexota bacterium]
MKNVTRWIFATVTVMSVLSFSVSSCRPTTTVTEEHAHIDEIPSITAVTLGAGEKLQVIATTSIVADVVQNIGGDLIDLTLLIPLGTDPHAFKPIPQDVVAVADAHVVFANGAGLEEFLEPLLQSAGEGVMIVPVSYGIELLQFGAEHDEEDGQHQGGADPHTWFDPHNVMVWAHNIEHALSALDPAHVETYEANAEAYQAQLEALDAWIKEQVSQLPATNRKLVTDHTTFSYLARRYGFEQIGAVFPGYSTLSEPSARELAALEDAIREHDAHAVFVGVTVNPDLAQRVIEDTGTQLVFLYTGSLSKPGGDASDYFSLMRYNVSAIVEALR